MKTLVLDSLGSSRFGVDRCAAVMLRTGQLFSNVDLADRVLRDHPLQAIRQIVNDWVDAQWEPWLLIGRSRREPDALAYYFVFAPAPPHAWHRHMTLVMEAAAFLAKFAAD